MKASAIATPLVAAIESAWSAIQANHEDVPDVVVTVGSGIVRQGVKLGHFQASSWTRNGEDGKVHELFIGAEGLERGAVAVMATLLHESAHAYAEANGVKDTSRQGRYHNDKFRLIAETFGLKLSHDPVLGWSTSEMPEETAAEYEAAIFALDLAITAHRQMPKMVQLPATPGTTTVRIPKVAPGRKSNNNGVSASCSCGRKIRVSRTVLDMGDIVCSVCGEPFAE